MKEIERETEKSPEVTHEIWRLKPMRFGDTVVRFGDSEKL